MTGPSLDPIPREAPVLIAGPTASGKSALAMELAARDGRLIVNADALQVYECWRILTARPTPQDVDLAPHALYGSVGRTDPWSVGHWLRAVRPLLDRPVVIVGGTGLYFHALTVGLAEIPEIPATVRAEADALRLSGDMAAFLAGIDPETRARIDTANPARLQRAWEVQRATGRGLAAWQSDTGVPVLPLSDCHPLVLRPPVDWLNRRIDGRFLAMIDAGALDEARVALPWWTPSLPAARAIGAAELVSHLNGAMSLDQAIAAAQLATRQYAKRQRTWFRNRMRGWQEFALG